jgi:hypothetical protein
MATLGARALIDLAIPTGIDGSKVLQFQLRDGRTAQQVIAEAAAVIGEVNAELDRMYGGLAYQTENFYSIYRQGEGSRTETPKKSEFVPADAVRSDTIGHMLPLTDYEDAVAWTPLYLRRAYAAQITADLQLIAERWKNRVAKELWTRALTDTETAIDDSTTGYSVGWAIGTGANVNYIPPQYGNNVFTSSHIHYDYLDDDSNDWGDLLEDMVQDLREHGIGGRLVCFVSGTDVSEWAALTSFVELNPTGVTVVAGNTSAPIRITQGEFEGLPGELFGYVKDIRGLVELRYDDRIPTNYCFLTKTWGLNNPRNPLAIRIEDSVGFGLRVVPMVKNSLNPELETVQFEATHGIGVNDRLMGVAGYLNSGANAWVDATVS